METLNDKMVPQKPFHEILSEIQAVLKDENARVMAKVGRNLGQRWAQAKKDEGIIPASFQQLFDWIAHYLQNELFTAQKVEIIPGKNYIKIKFGVYDSDEYQCNICCSHLVKQKGGQSTCPVSSFMLGAYRVFKNNLNIKKIQLEKIRKPVSKKPGACEQIFTITR
ncbi:MAG: hypothetical protein ACXAC8_08680 [Candidatus Hodarchaeales archaeon]|jgi:hypothetical protein